MSRFGWFRSIVVKLSASSPMKWVSVRLVKALSSILCWCGWSVIPTAELAMLRSGENFKDEWKRYARQEAERLLRPKVGVDELKRLVAESQAMRPLPPEKLWRRYERDPEAYSKGRADWSRILTADPEHLLTLKSAYATPGLAFEHFYAMIEAEKHEAEHIILRSTNEDELRHLRARHTFALQLLSIPKQLEQAEKLAESLLEMGSPEQAGDTGFIMDGTESNHPLFQNEEEVDGFQFFR